MQARIVECVHRLGENSRHPSLQTHPVQGHKGVFEAYVDKKNRVTFEYARKDGARRIVLRRHCNHAMLGSP